MTQNRPLVSLQRLVRLLDHRKGIFADIESLMREDERRGLRKMPDTQRERCQCDVVADVDTRHLAMRRGKYSHVSDTTR